MSKVSLKLSTVLFLTLVGLSQVNAATYKTGNDNFTLIYNENKEIASTFLSLTYLNSNPTMDSFSIIASTNGTNQQGVQLIGDIKTNTITAYTYDSGNAIALGEITNNTIFDDGVIADPTAPWNLLKTGMDITDNWKVINGEVNLKDALISSQNGHSSGKTTGKFVDLDGDGLAGTISKTIKTEAGETYTLTFDHIASPHTSNGQYDKPFKLKVGDKEVDFVSEFGAQNRTTETVTFTATSDSTDISFISASLGVANTGAYLDDIKITKNTSNAERLETIYGAITSTGFSVDLEEINKLSEAKGGAKFEISDTASIQFQAGNNSEFIYDGQDIVRYNATFSDIANFNNYATGDVTTDINNAVSEPTGLLAMFTAVSLFFVSKRCRIK